MTDIYAQTECTMCGGHGYCRPLHGDKGGPMCCLTCLGKWHGEHGRRRKWGLIVTRAIAAYLEAGGKRDDIEKLTVAVGGIFDPLGYGFVADEDAPELTSELLTRAISLVHPDKHPPERRELAASVTGELTALQPFVFPAKKKEPEPPSKPRKATKSDKLADELRAQLDETKKIPERYPCSDCADAVPMDYCDACKAEYERREQVKFERRTAKQRAQYALRRKVALATRPPAFCAVCGKGFKSKRADSRYCSDRCRQQAHRKPVTDKQKHHRSTLFNRDRLEGAILALINRHRAVYLNDLLPADWTSAQYQMVRLVATKLEAEGKIDSCCCGYRGYKVLTKPGHTIKDRKITLLKDNERLRL